MSVIMINLLTSVPDLSLRFPEEGGGREIVPKDYKVHSLLYQLLKSLPCQIQATFF